MNDQTQLPPNADELAESFMQQMMEQNRRQRARLGVPVPAPPAVTEQPTINAEEVRSRQIEKELGVTSGVFKFKKHKKRVEDVEDATPLSRPTAMKPPGVDEGSLLARMAAFTAELDKLGGTD